MTHNPRASHVAMLASLAVAAAIAICTTSAATDPTAGEKSKANRKPPRPKLTLSREVTYLTEPLAADGLVDYAAALNANYGKGVTPENNAAVFALQALGPDKYGSIDEFRKLCERLGVEPLAPKSRDFFIQLHDFIEEVRAEFAENEAATAARMLLPVEELRRQLDRDDSYKPSETLARSSWTAIDEPLAAAWLLRIEKSLDSMTRASSMPQFYVPLDPKEPFAGMLFTSQISFRTLALSDALAARATFRMARGEHDAAWSDVMTARRWAAKASSASYLIDKLAGLALARRAASAAAIVLTNPSYDEKRLRAMQKDWNSVSISVSLANSFEEGDRCFSLEAMNLLYRVALDPRWIAILEGGGAAPPAETDSWRWKRVFLGFFYDWDAAYATVNRHYDALAKVAHMPPGKDRRTAALRFDEKMERLGADRMNPFQWFTIAALDSDARRTALARYDTSTRFATNSLIYFVSLLDVETQSQAQEALINTSFALSIHRAASGTYPARLDDLVPALLSRVPIDDFGDQPLKYARSADGGFTLYSFGRNRIDNQGRSTDPLADTTQKRKRESAQADDENESDIEPELYDDEADDLVIRIEGKRKA